MASNKLIFVLDRRSTRYIDRAGEWVASFEHAATFESVWEAFDFCSKNSLQQAEIVMRVGEPIYDIKIPFR